jgi:hypothetical protein
MSNAAANFVITKGFINTFTFTIKADNSTLPITIDAGDTFTAALYNIDPAITTVVDSWTMLPFGALANGQVQLIIPVIDTNGLTSLNGGEVDRYYAKPSYKLVLDCDTLVNGAFLAKVYEVYVD